MKPEMVRKGAVSRKPRVGRSPTDAARLRPQAPTQRVCVLSGRVRAAAAAAATSGLRTDYKVTSCHY